MAGYPLQALLAVRWFREDAAKNEVRVAERNVLEAREKAGQCRAALEEYRAWWPAEVDRRYNGILDKGAQGEGMSLDSLDAFKAGLAVLADGELVRESAVVEADKVVAQCEAAVLAAHEAVAQARREAAKIETHREIWAEEEKKEAERKEDLELEEFHAPSKEDDEV